MQRQMQFTPQASYQQQVQMQPEYVNVGSLGYQQKQKRREELRTNMNVTKTAPSAAIVLSPEQEQLAKKFAESAKTASVQELRKLLKDGASPNFQMQGGDYPVHTIGARQDFNLEFCKMLFEETHKYEVNINAQNKSGQTILHLVCQKENQELSQYLLSKGADPNIQDSRGNTCLHLLASKSTVTSANEVIMQQCLSYGGNIELANNAGSLPNQLSSNVSHQRQFMQQKLDFDEGVIGGDVEVALSWRNMNDLDLHCYCSCGSHICFSSKVCSSCKGFLDVDMNVSPTTNTPVEHIYWAKIPKGTFQISVVFYRNHPSIPTVSEYLIVMKIKEAVVFEKSGAITREKEEQVIVTFKFDEGAKFSIIPNQDFKPATTPILQMPFQQQMPFPQMQVQQQMPFQQGPVQPQRQQMPFPQAPRQVQEFQ